MRKPSKRQIVIVIAVAIGIALLAWASPFLYFLIACRFVYCDM
jgi:hypothetical protein